MSRGTDRKSTGCFTRAYGVNLNPPFPQVITFTRRRRTQRCTAEHTRRCNRRRVGNAVVFSSLTTRSVQSRKPRFATNRRDCTVAANQRLEAAI